MFICCCCCCMGSTLYLNRRPFAFRHTIVGACIWLNLTLLLGQFTSLGTLQLGDASQTLRAENTTAPVTTDLLVALIEVGLNSLQHFAKVGLVVVLNGGQGQSGAGLAAHQTSQTCLALHNAIWYAHFAAQGGQEEHQLQERSQTLSPCSQINCDTCSSLGRDGFGAGGRVFVANKFSAVNLPQPTSE